jgi:hypothetical protein
MPPVSKSESYAAIEASNYKITGQYRYIDGDRFFYRCGGTVCEDTLVRDAFLQSRVNELDGHEITLIVRRVNACDLHVSSELACVRSSNGSAFVIEKWVNPFK